jgi:hypothetical protein
VAASVEAAPFRVCAFSFHGPEEIRVFEEHLSPEDFDVVDLSPHRLPEGSPPRGRPEECPPFATWLFALCRPDVRCDVVVYSAEFAGSFFGAYGKSLSLADMEEASCRHRCDGLFHAPREVFLLGCNTLATKAQDRRTPRQYLQVLLDHGFDQATAERVVGTRYGPLGPSFRESVRRIFAGVPRLYGFSSVAPPGRYTAPMLERYFRTKGDYRRWLEETGRDATRNAELLAAFRGTDLVQDTGLRRDEPAAADRDAVCRLYDESEPLTARLRLVAQLMARDDVLSFVPTIQLFIDRHPPEAYTGEDAALFDRIRRSDAARTKILALVRELDVSALELELAHFARHLGWLTADELHGLGVNAARELLHRPLLSEYVDVVCEIPRHATLRRDFDSDDLPAALFRHPEGVRLVDCLSPSDPRVSDRLAAALDAPDPTLRLWAAYALSRRLPLSDDVLVRLAGELGDPSSELRERVRWTLQAENAQKPLSAAVHAAVAARDPGLAASLAPAPRRRRSGLFW